MTPPCGHARASGGKPALPTDAHGQARTDTDTVAVAVWRAALIRQKEAMGILRIGSHRTFYAMARTVPGFAVRTLEGGERLYVRAVVEMVADTIRGVKYGRVAKVRTKS